MAHGLTFHHFAQPRQLIVNSSCRIIDMQQAINPRAKSIQISYMAHAPTIHNGSQHVRQPRSYRTNGINGMRTPRQAYEHISKPVKSQLRSKRMKLQLALLGYNAQNSRYTSAGPHGEH